MKKYLLGSFVLVFVFGLFITNVNLVVAQTSGGYADAVCEEGDKFNKQTGERCAVQLIPGGCQPGDKYSSITGEACGESAPVCMYPAFGSRGEDIKALQQKIHSAGFTLEKIDGIYGYMTAEAAARYYKQYPCPVNQNVIITGVSGPQNLKVNQEGDWKVSAYDFSSYDKSGKNLSYAVVWGDEGVYKGELGAGYAGISAKSWSQSATFTHKFLNPGTYTPKFRVMNENGDVAQTSLSVNVGNTISTSKIKVLSPNGGETLKKGTTQKIKWQDDIPCVTAIGYPCKTPTYNIIISSYNQYTSQSLIATVASEVTGSSYNWSVGQRMAADYSDEETVVFDGAYTIKVCRTNTNICDSSDSYFKIVSGVTSNVDLKVNGSSGPLTLLDNQKVAVRWTSSAKNSCYLAPVRLTSGGNRQSLEDLPPNGSRDVYTSIDTSGSNANSSGSDRIFISCDGLLRDEVWINLSNPSSITVLSPNGGETWQTGSSQTIKWNVGSDSSIKYVNFSLRSAVSQAGHDLYTLAPNIGSLTFTLPGDYPTGTYFLQIRKTDETLLDESNSSFTITSPTTQPSITVLSPNGGETWITGGNKTITWQGNKVSTYDVSLHPVFTSTPCTTRFCTSMPSYLPYPIAKNVYSSSSNFQGSYGWQVGNTENGSIIPDGKYTIQVCETGTGVCDSSDSPFSKVTLETLSSPTTVLGAETYTFTQKLMRGSQGGEVMELQKYLKGAGYYSGNLDGKFGVATEAGVTKFQTAKNIKVDGIVGTEMRAVLNK